MWITDPKTSRTVHDPDQKVCQTVTTDEDEHQKQWSDTWSAVEDVHRFIRQDIVSKPYMGERYSEMVFPGVRFVFRPASGDEESATYKLISDTPGAPVDKGFVFDKEFLWEERRDKLVSHILGFLQQLPDFHEHATKPYNHGWDEMSLGRRQEYVNDIVTQVRYYLSFRTKTRGGDGYIGSLYDRVPYNILLLNRLMLRNPSSNADINRVFLITMAFQGSSLHKEIVLTSNELRSENWRVCANKLQEGIIAFACEISGCERNQVKSKTISHVKPDQYTRYKHILRDN